MNREEIRFQIEKGLKKYISKEIEVTYDYEWEEFLVTIRAHILSVWYYRISMFSLQEEPLEYIIRDIVISYKDFVLANFLKNWR